MAYVKFNSGFKVGSHSAIDARIILSKVDMLSAEEDFAMPDVYFAVCKNDGQMYVFNKDNEFDPETGKFRLVSSQDPCKCKIEESEINGNIVVNEEELKVYRLPAEYDEYLKKVTYKTPTIDTFMMLQGSGAAIPTVTESGVTFSVASIRHKESNLENINGGLTINSFLPVDPSANVITVPMRYPASISEDTDFTLSGTDTNGKSFSKTYSIRFNTYVYYDLVPIGGTPSTTPRNTWISDKAFTEEGYEFTYSAGETLCMLAPKSGLKVQTKVLGTWADVDYTEDDTVYDITQSNGAASFRYCYRVNFEVGSGSAIYRLVQGD